MKALDEALRLLLFNPRRSAEIPGSSSFRPRAALGLAPAKLHRGSCGQGGNGDVIKYSCRACERPCTPARYVYSYMRSCSTIAVMHGDGVAVGVVAGYCLWIQDTTTPSLRHVDQQGQPTRLQNPPPVAMMRDSHYSIIACGLFGKSSCTPASPPLTCILRYMILSLLLLPRAIQQYSDHPSAAFTSIGAGRHCRHGLRIQLPTSGPIYPLHARPLAAAWSRAAPRKNLEY